MKVLLVNPSQENFLNSQTGWTFGLRDVGYYQPLGILYVATYLKTHCPHIEVKVIDAASPDLPYPRLRLLMGEFRPDVVGISTYTHTFIDALTVSRIAKELNPDVHVSMGGHHLSYFAKETLTHPTVDSVVLGEGEIKFAALVRRIESNLGIEGVDGVFTRLDQDQIDAYDKSRHFMPDITGLPYPDRGFVGDHHYYNLLSRDKRMTTLISSRGCPYNCSFCPQGREPYRARAGRDVVDEIELCFNQGYTEFFFAEDTFNINKQKVIEFCDELLRRSLKITWCCKARIGGMDREVLIRMKESGCHLINFGVETGTDEGLRAMHKGTTTAEIRKVFGWCREAGIQTMAYFMIGHPFERTAQDVSKNISYLISINPDYCNINSFNPIPFTPLFDEGVRKGLLDYEPWRNMVLTGQPFVPKNWEEHFTKEQIQKMRHRSLLRFYFRPRYIYAQLRNIVDPGQFFYKARVALNILFASLSAEVEN